MIKIKTLLALPVLSFLSFQVYADSACDTPHELPVNQWQQISLPCAPGINNSVDDVFGDDELGVYDSKWVVFSYDSDLNKYIKLERTDGLSQGVGYWIIQINDSDKTLNMPATATPALDSPFEIPLATTSGTVGWSMIGYPFENGSTPLSQLEISNNDPGSCGSGCTLDEAKNNHIVHDEFWTYSGGPGYTRISTGGALEPWRGYWSATLNQADPTDPLLKISRPAPVSIMALGDSITQSNATHLSYRYPLWKKLLDSDVNFDLVGRNNSNLNGNPDWPEYLGKSFDQDHEGYWGHLVAEVLAWLNISTDSPDVVLLHLGTNDEIFRSTGDEMADTVQDLRNIVTRLREMNPSVVVLLAKLIPYQWDGVLVQNPALNAQLDSLAQELNSETSPVVIVDQNSGFIVGDDHDTFGGVHPNASGEEKMAQKWHDAIMPFVN